MVYLAEDTRLQRRVAIKTVLLGDRREQEVQTLLAEARTVSRLQHPNIVTLYDAGEENGVPYLVFEFVEGDTLAKLIADKGRLLPARAAEIAIQILEGVGYAHQMDVLHRDLKPANIMIDRKGMARVMDFGIASRVSSARDGGEEMFGTPLYMAPEYIEDRQSTPQADIFAIGMMLYEMLAGRPAVSGGNLYEILHNVVHATFTPPSRLNGEVDKRLDEIVMHALEKSPADRPHSAEEMAAALKDYLAPRQQAVPAANGKQVALDFLLLKMRRQSNFPALSRTVSVINKIIESDQQSASTLSNVILKDFALTNTLLKLVNTAYYQQFGGNISTVSRAVTIIGFEAVRNLAISLMLFDKLQDKDLAAHLRDEVIAAFFCGILARRLVPVLGFAAMEEAFICAMLHNLGRLLVLFYFREEYAEILRRIAEGEEPQQAAASVLNLNFEEIGIGVAQAWHFPDKIIYSMRKLTLDGLAPPSPEDEHLRQLALLANDLGDTVRAASPEERERSLARLVEAFSRHFTLNAEQLTEVVEKAVQDMLREAVALNLDLLQSPFFKQVSAWSAAADRTLDRLAAESLHGTLPPAGEGTPPAAAAPDPLAVLSAGIQDVTNTLMGADYKLNDILHIILETMYRAMGFSRVLLCAADPQRHVMRGRFGLGRDISRLASDFSFPLAYSPDIFHQALQQRDYLLVKDLDAEEIRDHVPDWYRRLVPARTVLLLPLTANRHPVGMIYADKDRGSEFDIGPRELNLLRTLRNQAILALEKKHPGH
jgi:serine/threonine protein kinase